MPVGSRLKQDQLDWRKSRRKGLQSHICSTTHLPQPLGARDTRSKDIKSGRSSANPEKKTEKGEGEETDEPRSRVVQVSLGNESRRIT